MKPYYERAGVVLYHADCLDVMVDMTAGSVESVITDPPYCAGAVSEAQRTRANGQGLRSENLKRFGWFVGDNMGTAGLVWLLRSVACAAKYVTSPSGSLLVFCDWRMLASLQPAIESAGLRYQNLIVWDKVHMGLGCGFRARHELVMHFTMGGPEYHDKGTSNVIPCDRVGRDDREHQTQKPEELLSRMIQVVTPVGGRVLDPFAGSGTTLLAAWRAGRQAVGSEVDESCCEVAAKRLDAEISRGRLFAPEPAQAEQTTLGFGE